jgi:CheY-like chemotaxis protein
MSARRSLSLLTGFAVEDAPEGNVMSQIGKKAILVVEDEVLIRLATREGIEAAGFQVHDAHDADEAIQLLEANPDIGLIFTDVDMPGSMDGVKLSTAEIAPNQMHERALQSLVARTPLVLRARDDALTIRSKPADRLAVCLGETGTSDNVRKRSE